MQQVEWQKTFITGVDYLLIRREGHDCMDKERQL